MFENLKNFIRNGKQAHTNNQKADTLTANYNPSNNRNISGVSNPVFDDIPINHNNNYSLQSQQYGGAQPGGLNNCDSKTNLIGIKEEEESADASTSLQNSGILPSKTQVNNESNVQQQQQIEEKKFAYDVAIQQIIQEENLEKRKMPSYPGLERYHLLEKMGDGAFSVVYNALDLQSGLKVAVKVVRKFEMNASNKDRHLGQTARKEKKTSQRSTILKEVAIMRQLNHDNIVELKDFIESDQHYFIILELLPGGELFHQIVRLTYFSEDLSRHVITQVAEAVRYLHEEVGVIHRDIKPENLLFYPIDHVPSVVVGTDNTNKPGEEEPKVDEGQFIPGVGSGGIGVIKLADFGLSKVVWDTNTMTPCGTVGYTAPEIVKDQRYSKSVDMWALGCVLYTILCGFPPFYDESIEDLTEKVAKGEYTFLSPWWDEISDSAKDLVAHLLTVNPEDRYDISEFLQHPWIKCGRDQRSTKAVNKTKVDISDHQPSADVQRFINHPTLETNNADGFRSPAAVALKEVFDVSYAVHRMEEENARRNRGGLGLINDISEVYDSLDEDDDDDDISELQRFSNDPRNPRLGENNDDDMSNLQNRLTGVNLGRGSKNRNNNSRTRGNRQGGGFELNINGATLLEKRKLRKQQEGGGMPTISAVMMQ